MSKDLLEMHDMLGKTIKNMYINRYNELVITTQEDVTCVVNQSCDEEWYFSNEETERE